MARGYRDVIGLAEKLGPCKSSKLVTALVGSGVSAETARQQVSRAVRSHALASVKGVKLPHGESFVYLREHFESEIFIQRLFEDLAASQSIVAHAIHGIQARGGLIPRAHFPAISGCPYRIKGQLSYQRVEEFLLNYNLLEIRRIESIGECLQLSQSLPFEITTPVRLKARLIAEEITIQHVERWFARMGIIGFNSAEVRSSNSQPEFGQFFWDMTAPSYVHPFVSKRPGADSIPGFVVADLMVTGQMRLRHVQSFLRKCEVLRHQKATRPFLSLLICEHFETDAFNLVRNHGAMAVTTNNLLGDDLAEALKSLIKVLSNTAASIEAGPDHIGEIFNSLSAIEGAANNLRGPLFELLVAHCVGREGGTIDVQKTIRDNSGELTDIDVFRFKPNFEIVAYECKGHLANVVVPASEVEKWFNATIRKTRDWLQRNEETYQQLPQRFEFWTTGKFHADAISFLEERKSSVRKFSIDWKDGSQVLEYVSRINTGKLDVVLREHYLKHPLAIVEQRAFKRRRQKNETKQAEIEVITPSVKDSE